MTTALTLTGPHPTKLIQQKECPFNFLQTIPGQTLAKTIQVYLDANLAEISDPSKKINRQVEKIPTVNELLKGIIENRESLLNETRSKHIHDIESLFSSLTKLKDTASSSSLVSFDLLDTVYSIAIKLAKFNLSDNKLNYRSVIISHCTQLAAHYQRNGGNNFKHFISRKEELLKSVFVSEHS